MSENVFESKSVVKTYFTMALPVVLGMLVTIVYNLTDTYFVALTQNTNLVDQIINN